MTPTEGQTTTEAKGALIDARTMYDILKARADDPKSSRDDVLIAEIALRNFNFVADVTAGAKTP